jgi:hypothetical protein
VGGIFTGATTGVVIVLLALLVNALESAAGGRVCRSWKLRRRRQGIALGVYGGEVFGELINDQHVGLGQLLGVAFFLASLLSSSRRCLI